MPLVLLLVGLLILAVLIPGRPRMVVRCITLFIMCIIVLPLMILVNTAGWTTRLMLLDPSFHLAMLKKADIYAAVPDLLSEMIGLELEKKADLKPVQRDEALRLLRAGIAESVPPSWVESEMSRLVSGSLDFLKGGSRPPELSVSLRDPKAKAIEFLAAQKMPSPFLAEIKKMMSGLPDEISPFGPTDTQTGMALAGIRPQVQMVMLAGPAASLATMVLLLLAWLVSGRSRAFAAWLGSGCLLGGIGVAVLSMAGKISLLRMTGGLMLPHPFSVLPVQAWAELTILKVLATVQMAGSGVAVAGVLCFAVPLLVRRLPAKGAAPTAPKH